MDGTGTVLTVLTAGANGSYVSKLIVRALGTNVATVVRVFVNNGLTNGTAANNALIGELSIPATTASTSQAQPSFEIPVGFAIPASYLINVTIGTTVSAGLIVTASAGNY
jgi:hypothetical protein